MIVAFAGSTGRIQSSRAARLCAHAVHAAGLGMTLVRAVGPGIPIADPYTVNVEVVTVPADAQRVAAAITAAVTSGSGEHAVVADLPHDLMANPAIQGIVDVRVLTVGSHRVDERSALALLAGLDAHRDPGSGAPVTAQGGGRPWLLGCDRGGGGPAAAAFSRSIAEASAAFGADIGRILPVAMGPLTRSEDIALEAGQPSRRNLRDGTVLALALRKVLADPLGARDAGPGFDAATERERIAMTSDERSLPERLRDLADDIDALVLGGGPSEAELASAPVLDHWIRDVVPTPVLKGLVSNHPGIATGRPVRTTEVFATDNATYARTLSRLYALRVPGGPSAPGRLQ